ncbi:YciI family protein [Dyella silvatica]|uniref:YciI family protein n=1 Tax=Dyella silvatica TaxID=2992128 RepID=UPI002252F6E6|nr:YciI family protein [Dyella silvatica]
MFLINSSYITELSQVEPHRKAHGEWVAKYIEEGTFLFAGPKRSKQGGIIVAKRIEKARLLQILSEDSYVSADVVENQIVDFDAVFTRPELVLLASL